MTSLKRVVPADKTKYYPDEYDYLSSFGDTLGQLVAPVVVRIMQRWP